MQRKDIVTLMLTLVSGTVAFIFVMNLLNRPVAAGLTLVMAKQEIAANTIITEEMLELSKPIKDKDPELFFLQVKDVAGSKATVPISQNALVERAQVRRVSDEELSARSIPEGMRVLGVSASSIELIPDSLAEGQFVDILGKVAFSGRPTELRTLYRAAKIVAVKKNDSKGEIASLMLALSPQGAEVVTRAILQGKLGLLVRTEAGPNEATGVADGLDTPPAPATAPVLYTEIIRGIAKEKSVAPSNTPAETPAASTPAAAADAGLYGPGQIVVMPGGPAQGPDAQTLDTQ